MSIFGIDGIMDEIRERRKEVHNILKQINELDIGRSYDHAKRAHSLHISGEHSSGISGQGLAEAFSGLVNMEKKRNALIGEYNDRIMEAGCRVTFNRIEPTNYSKMFPM